MKKHENSKTENTYKYKKYALGKLRINEFLKLLTFSF